jgi:hypothetical protein
LTEQSLEIAASVDSVNDDVSSDWQASKSGKQVVIAAATHVRMF